MSFNNREESPQDMVGLPQELGIIALASISILPSVTISKANQNCTSPCEKWGLSVQFMVSPG